MNTIVRVCSEDRALYSPLAVGTSTVIPIYLAIFSSQLFTKITWGSVP